VSILLRKEQVLESFLEAYPLIVLIGIAIAITIYIPLG
jgi:hypothetical protein